MERRALVLRDMGRGAEAIAELERALALLPPDPVSHGHAVILATLASALLRASEWKAAADAAQRAIAAARASMAEKEEAALPSASGLSGPTRKRLRMARKCSAPDWLWP